MKILYEPVLREGLRFFTVNGAISENRDEAIRLASNHSSVKSEKAKIVRINEIECDDNGIEI